MAHYAGVLSVDTLFDALEARLPSERTEMKKAAMIDDCAAARLFMRTVDTFIDDVIGIDPKTKRARSRGGLFGKAKAYFGMVETQGRGTLHIHFLIWLCGTPANSTEFDTKVLQEGVVFLDGLAEYLDSIVTNKLPLTTRGCRCTCCNGVGTMHSLPINPSSRKQSHKGTTVSRYEPLLVECTACKNQTSTQHVVRQLLLQNRPPHWPPPLNPLSSEEKTTRVEKESFARSSTLQAATVIRDRESFLSALHRDDGDECAVQELVSSDASQRPYSHPDDDPFKRDTMARLIEITPPAVDWSRMSPAHQEFMLTSLVANLNMHWWGHTER